MKITITTYSDENGNRIPELALYTRDNGIYEDTILGLETGGNPVFGVDDIDDIVKPYHVYMIDTVEITSFDDILGKIPSAGLQDHVIDMLSESECYEYSRRSGDRVLLSVMDQAPNWACVQVEPAARILCDRYGVDFDQGDYDELYDKLEELVSKSEK